MRGGGATGTVDGNTAMRLCVCVAAPQHLRAPKAADMTMPPWAAGDGVCAAVTSVGDVAGAGGAATGVAPAGGGDAAAVEAAGGGANEV